MTFCKNLAQYIDNGFFSIIIKNHLIKNSLTVFLSGQKKLFLTFEFIIGGKMILSDVHGPDSRR